MPTQKNFFRTYAAQSRPISCQDHCSYLPNLANLAQDIDSLAHKIRGVPSSLLHRSRRPSARCQETAGVNARKPGRSCRTVHGDGEELGAIGRRTGDRRQLHRIRKRYLARNAGVFGGLATILEDAYAQIGIHCIDTLSYMEWTLKSEFSQEEDRSQ